MPGRRPASRWRGPAPDSGRAGEAPGQTSETHGFAGRREVNTLDGGQRRRGHRLRGPLGRQRPAHVEPQRRLPQRLAERAGDELGQRDRRRADEEPPALPDRGTGSLASINTGGTPNVAAISRARSRRTSMVPAGGFIPNRTLS